MSTSTLAVSCLTLPTCLDSWTQHSRFLCNIALYSFGPGFYHQSHPRLGVVFSLWLHPFILSGVISPLITSSILGTYWPGEFIFQCPIFCLFILFMGFSREEYWSGLTFPSPVDHVLSAHSTIIRLSWMALHGIAYSFIELDKAVVHVIRWFIFCHCGFQSVCCLTKKDGEVQVLTKELTKPIAKGCLCISHINKGSVNHFLYLRPG